MYGSKSLLWQAGPSAPGAAGELRHLVLLPPLMMPCMATVLKLLLLSVQFNHPEKVSKPSRTFSIQLRLISTMGEDIQPLVGSWKPFAQCMCEVQLIHIQLCSTPTPEHFNSLWFLLLPLQAHTLTPEIHTRLLSYAVHKNTSHISQ